MRFGGVPALFARDTRPNVDNDDVSEISGDSCF